MKPSTWRLPSPLWRRRNGADIIIRLLSREQSGAEVVRLIDHVEALDDGVAGHRREHRGDVVIAVRAPLPLRVGEACG